MRFDVLNGNSGGHLVGPLGQGETVLQCGLEKILYRRSGTT